VRAGAFVRIARTRSVGLAADRLRILGDLVSKPARVAARDRRAPVERRELGVEAVAFRAPAVLVDEAARERRPLVRAAGRRTSLRSGQRNSDAIATSATRVHASQMRSSSVGKRVAGRIAHHR
jgi:hypothetical protein